MIPVTDMTEADRAWVWETNIQARISYALELRRTPWWCWRRRRELQNHIANTYDAERVLLGLPT